jgi:hypothetical protein
MNKTDEAPGCNGSVSSTVILKNYKSQVSLIHFAMNKTDEAPSCNGKVEELGRSS